MYKKEALMELIAIHALVPPTRKVLREIGIDR